MKTNGNTIGRPVIYQMLPRLFTNYNESLTPDGTIQQNGCGKINAITPKILREIKNLGVTHIWYTGIIEHATKTDYSLYGISPDNKYIVKGEAGSPYAIKDYFDIDPDLAEDIKHRMDEFESLVKRTHQEDMKVIIDFVPNHLAREYHSDSAPAGTNEFGFGDDKNVFFSRDNNFYYFPGETFSPHIDLGPEEGRFHEFPAKATGNDCFTTSPGVNDWYETVKLNYGVDYRTGHREFNPIPDTWHKMAAVLEFWADKGVDGFRCDMAFMVPVEFWNWAIPRVKKSHPDLIFIAEIYDLSLYRKYIFTGGFDYLYDKVTMYDTIKDIVQRHMPASGLTSCWQAIDGLQTHMLHFMENHDEVRIASPQYVGDPWKALPGWVATVLMTYGPVMLYAGQELGEKGTDSEGFSGYDGKTTIFDYWSIPSIRQWLDGGKCDGLDNETKLLQDIYRRTIEAAKTDVAANGRFFDLMYVNFDNPRFDTSKNFAFFKATEEKVMAVVINFGDETAEVAVNIPEHAFEIYNLPQGKVMAVNMFDGIEREIYFSSSQQMSLTVPAHDAVALKFKISDIRRNANA